MLDAVTLDQLRTLVTVVEEGNFSAAARKLKRVQSAVSTAMANLESQLDVVLWDRSTKVATLTEAGRAVLARARRVVGEMDELRAFTKGLHGGVEASVSLCVDTLFPVAALVEACGEFAQAYPAVDLRVDTQTMSAVTERVAEGPATLGIVSPLGLRPNLTRRALAAIRMLPVVAPSHPLARVRGKVPAPRLQEHVQIVLSERGDEGVPDQAVLSSRTWRIADLSTKHAMLLRGLGWGNLPEHLVRHDLAEKKLVRIVPEAWAEDEHTLRFYAVTKPDHHAGPAEAWLLDVLERRCEDAVSTNRDARSKGRNARRGRG